MAFEQKLKLILSADLIGSTSIKQNFNELNSGDEGLSDWPLKIQRFYSSFDKFVVSTVDRIDEECLRYLKDDADASSVGDVTRDQASALRGELLGPPPVFWKTVGDEVLYWKVVESPLQLITALSYWLRVIDEVRKELNPHWSDNLYKSSDGFLDVKSTAWLASFPIRNRVTFKGADRPRHPDTKVGIVAALAAEDEGRDLSSLLEQLYALDDEQANIKDELKVAKRDSVPHYDFIGPSIDTGFRISSFSDSKKMSIDVSIAFMLSKIFSDQSNFVKDVSQSSSEDAVMLQDEKFEQVCCSIFPKDTGYSSGTLADRLRVYYSGSETLKGVAGGNPYPKFWINSAFSDSYEDLKENATWGEIRKPSSWAKLQKFCNVYFDHRKKYTLRPFLKGDEHFPVPSEYEALQEAFTAQNSA